MNYELILDNAFNRTSKDKPKEGTIFKEADLDLSPIHTERYFSMFGFDNSIYKFVEINHTVSDFNGHYFCKYVYFDVDDDSNLEFALHQTQELVKNIYNQLEVLPEHLFISFSGSKGFHVGMHHKLFGNIEPDKNIPAQIKTLACSILSECYNIPLQDVLNVKTKYKGCDMGIYNKNRIFRTLNSKNAKSGLYKIGLSSRELLSLTIAEIQELAKKPRPEFRTETPIKDLKPYGTLTRLYQDVLALQNVEAGDKQKKHRESTGNFFSPPTSGSRNKDLFAQACMIFDHSDFAAESVRQLVSCINLASPEPVDDNELNTIIKSAKNRTSKNERYSPKDEPKVKDIECFNDWLDEWVEYYTSDRKKLTLLFDDFDADQENQLIGKMLTIIGSGGTRKSYYGQNLMVKNILDHGARCIYSSMEMGKVEVVNRLLDMYFEPYPEYPNLTVSKVMQLNLKTNKKETVDMVREASRKLSDNLVLSASGSMDCESYGKLVERTRDLFGSADMLVIDGLSMMKTKGSESDTMMKNSAEIKQLAREKELFIPVICHTTKESNEFVRDSKRFVRGSEKILDNTDFLIMCASLIDKERSSLDDIQAVEGYGHIRYFNKRGTGKVINKVYSFDSKTKSVLPSIRFPEEFPTYERFTKDAAKAASPDSKKNGRRNAVVEEAPF